MKALKRARIEKPRGQIKIKMLANETLKND